MGQSRLVIKYSTEITEKLIFRCTSGMPKKHMWTGTIKIFCEFSKPFLDVFHEDSLVVIIEAFILRKPLVGC